VIGGRFGLAIFLVLIAIAESASAQDAPALAPHRFILSAGAIAGGGYAVGDQTAELRRNAGGNPAPFTLFRAESSFEGTTGFDARVDFALARSVAVEVGATYSTPLLGVTVSGDSESDPAVQLAEEIAQYSVDVSGVWHLAWPSLGRRARPYVILGGGYLRQLHEDRLVADTGGLLHAGGGVWLWFTGESATRRAIGLRAEARLVRRSGGIEFEDRSRNYPAFSILGFLGL
jgi:hypothetical protein